MNITLIYPNISKQERYGSKIGESGGSQQPLGILYLASYLRSNNFSVKLIDAECENLSNEQILNICTSFKTDIYCISTTTVVFSKAISLAEYIKEYTPDIPVVVGGPHISGDPINSMKHTCFDIGVIGEGEATLLEIANSYRNGKTLDNINGIIYRRNGEIVKNSPRELINNLDDIPLPARDLLPPLVRYLPPPINYKGVPCATIITSRGCPYSCTFCDKNTFGSKYRIRSAENVIEEIKHLIKHYSIKEIAFVDDTFNINNKRLNRLFDLLRENNIRLPWTCMARINTTSYEQLRAMKEAGCWHISFGIESGNKDIIKLIKKGIDLDYTRQVIRWCKELGIQTKGFFMIGHPGETKETIKDTIDFALSVPLTHIVATINTPLPGSWNYDNVEKFGTMSTIDWSKHNYWIPVFIPHGLTEEYLQKKHAELNRRFYFRSSVILRQISGLRRISDAKRFMKMAVSALSLLFERK